MTDRELLTLLRQRLSRKLFDGNPTVERCGEEWRKASDSTAGVGMACFATSREQDEAFNKAFSTEAVAARPYIYALEKLAVRLLAERK